MEKNLSVNYSNIGPSIYATKPDEEDKTMGADMTEVPAEAIAPESWNEEMGEYVAPDEKAELGAAVSMGKSNTVPKPKAKVKKPDAAREAFVDEVERSKRTYDDKDPFGNVRVTQLYSFAQNPFATLENVKEGVLSGYARLTTADLYTAARDFCGPKVKQEQIEKIVKSNPADVGIAYVLGAANVKNVGSDYLKEVSNRGIDIGQYCKFGKSKKLYKAIKVPKVLFGLRAINPPSPAMFVMRLLNFIWRVLNTGISRVPGPFLRVGLAFFKNLGGVTTTTKMFGSVKRVYESPFTKKMLLKALSSFEEIAPGLIGAYNGYLQDTKILADIKSATRMAKQTEKYNTLKAFYEEIPDVNQAADMFARALKEASGNIPKEATKKLSGPEVNTLLNTFTDGPKKPTLLKSGEYRNVKFGGKKK